MIFIYSGLAIIFYTAVNINFQSFKPSPEEEKNLAKKPLIGVSILAVFLLVMGSLSSVVGYQSVQISQQNLIKERINQRELLFQTIVDIANNKEIQRIILKSQMSRGVFPTSEIPVLTKTQIRQIYFLGLILSKVISKTRIQSLVEKYQFNNQGIQKEINAVIEKDTTINAEITQLKNSECGCENEYGLQWNFPVLCLLLVPLLILSIAFYVMFGFGILGNIMGIIGGILHCSWY
jgi:hypothetical protein